MAVTLVPKSTRLQVKYTGAIVNGKETIVSKTYSKVKPTATEQALYDTAQAIAALQTNAVHSINKLADAELNQI